MARDSESARMRPAVTVDHEYVRFHAQAARRGEQSRRFSKRQQAGDIGESHRPQDMSLLNDAGIP